MRQGVEPRTAAPPLPAASGSSAIPVGRARSPRPVRRGRSPGADPDPQQPDEQPADVEDLDEIAIERAVIGDGIRFEQLTPAEQEEVVRRLTERGKSIRHIAGQLGTTKRTVSRRRRSAASAA
jgi:DNA-binding NarL/FixJ family response regulator